MKNLKKRLIKFFKDEKNILFAYLYGSYSDETFCSESDIDIAVYVEDYSFDYYTRLVYELEKVLQKKVDLQILNNTKNLYLLENIIKNGILLKDHSKKDEFELRKLHELIDFKELNRRLESA
jgi:predicted nucleotidyltransferase